MFFTIFMDDDAGHIFVDTSALYGLPGTLSVLPLLHYLHLL